MLLNIEAAERGVPRLTLSPAEAAECLGLACRRIYDAIESREITARRDRKRTLIELSELQRWIRSLPYRGRPPEDGTAAYVPQRQYRGRPRKTTIASAPAFAGEAAE